MKWFIAIVTIALLTGCATSRREVGSSSPVDDNSIGIHLMLTGQSYNKPTWGQVGVEMLVFNNNPRPVWIFPQYTFFGVHNGTTQVLRHMEENGRGWHLSPYHRYSALVDIPEPPVPGVWKIFVVMDHSPAVYARYTNDHNPKPPYRREVDERDWMKAVMWDKSVRSNTIQVEFIEKPRSEHGGGTLRR